MNNNKLTTMFVFIFLVAAMSFIASADNITYTYRMYGEDIAADTILIPDQENVTLPNTTWNLELSNNDSKFKVSLANINATAEGYPELNITARLLDLGIQNYDGNLQTSGTYAAKYGYGFDIAQYTALPYTVKFNYAALGVTNPRIFKCAHNFTSGITNTSSCSDITGSTDGTYVSASATGFSSFFLAQYTAPYVPTSGGGTGGGGGGGGGGAGGPRIVYVTPSPEGDSVQVYNGDELIIQYKGNDYHYRVIKAVPLKVQLKSLQTYLETDIDFGDQKILGLTSYFAKDVKVSLHISNEFVMLTFHTFEQQGFPFQLLPPRPSGRASPAPRPQDIVQQPTVFTPRTTIPSTAQGSATQPLPEEIQLPESPINIWTIIFAIIFVIFLVGGVVLYRTRLHSLEKPPTVTRTGLEPSGLPETSSKMVSKPAHILDQEVAAAGAVLASKTEHKPAAIVHISHEKKLELEKYIFHAYSLGFQTPQVRKALIEKGWPENVVDETLEEIKKRK